MPSAIYHRGRHHPIAVRCNGDDAERHLSVADARELLLQLIDALADADDDDEPLPHDTLPSAAVHVDAVASVIPVPDAEPTQPRRVPIWRQDEEDTFDV